MYVGQTPFPEQWKTLYVRVCPPSLYLKAFRSQKGWGVAALQLPCTTGWWSWCVDVLVPWPPRLLWGQSVCVLHVS